MRPEPRLHQAALGVLMKIDMRFVIAAAVAVIAGWYLVDGRYEYVMDQRHNVFFRIDHLSSQVCMAYAEHRVWACK
jgi:hypothetical protein